MDLVFTAGTSNGTTRCLNVTIIDTEATVEYNETFIVTLSSDMEQEDNVTTVTIVDANGKYVPGNETLSSSKCTWV